MAINQYSETAFHIVLDEEGLYDFIKVAEEYWQWRYKAGFKSNPFSTESIKFYNSLFGEFAPPKGDSPQVTELSSSTNNDSFRASPENKRNKSSKNLKN